MDTQRPLLRTLTNGREPNYQSQGEEGEGAHAFEPFARGKVNTISYVAESVK